MNRKEVINLLCEKLDDICGEEAGHKLYPDDKYIAHCLLLALEEAGIVELKDERSI